MTVPWSVARVELSWWIGLDRALDGALSRHLAPTGAKLVPTSRRDVQEGPPMPAPHHLLPILAVLGDGGTTATAEAIAHTAGGLPGHTTAPSVDDVFAALGDGATRDVAARVVALYAPPAPAVVEEPAEEADGEPPQEPAEGDNEPTPVVDDTAPAADPQDAGDATDSADDIDWDDAPATEAVPEPTAADIRAWAKTEGIKVPARGAIPQDVRDQYNAAHQ